MIFKAFKRYISINSYKKVTDSKTILVRPMQKQITSRSNVFPDIKSDKMQHVIGKREREKVIANIITVLRSQEYIL